MSDRVQDFALMIGHAWRCLECREALLSKPEMVWIGYKLNEDQRERIRGLDDDSFQTIAKLTEATGLSTHDLELAIEHPRARLRHLGSVRGDYYLRLNGDR